MISTNCLAIDTTIKVQESLNQQYFCTKILRKTRGDTSLPPVVESCCSSVKESYGHLLSLRQRAFGLRLQAIVEFMQQFRPFSVD